MGASREITIAALVEPTILLAVFALSIPAGSANLGALVVNTIAHPGQVVSLAGVLAFVALVIVIIAETGRLPVDNPATHLELTMVHEAMVLEYAGPRLALVEWAGGDAADGSAGVAGESVRAVGHCRRPARSRSTSAIGVVAIAVKVGVLAALLAGVEVFIAKLRLFRVPELLAGSFLLALLAVTAANFFSGAGGRIAMTDTRLCERCSTSPRAGCCWRRSWSSGAATCAPSCDLLAWQGVALAAIPIVRGITRGSRELVAVGGAILALRGAGAAVAARAGAGRRAATSSARRHRW